RFVERAMELKGRVSVPPASSYRVIHLEELGKVARDELGRLDQEQSDALTKLDIGYKRIDIAHLSWGASRLREIRERMIAQRPVWTDQQIGELEPHIETARQTIIQNCPKWLSAQSPKSDSPDAVADFKHKMVRLIVPNLRALGLDTLCQEVETRTSF